MKSNLTRRLVIFSFFVVCILTPSNSQNCSPFSVPYPNMGVNIPDAIGLPWVNLWNQLNPWHSGYFSNPKTGNDLELGADGWPIAGKSHRIVIGEDVNVIMTIPADTIKISYKGTVSQFSETDANCTIISGSQRDNYPKPGYAFLKVKLDVPVVPNTQPGNHAIYAFIINGHVEDIKIMRPGFEIDDNTLIHPDYMRLLDKFSTFRFMPFLTTNSHQVDNEYDCQGPSSIDWNQRWNPNAPQSCCGTKGGSWEIAVELCNQFDKDMWINIPIVASDEYVTQLANMIKSNLKPGLNVNIEIGNETWNWGGGFCCSRQIEDKCNGDGNCHMIWQAERLKQVIEIFASTWSWNEINNRIRGILCGQIAYGIAFYDLGWTIQNGLEYIRNTYNESPGKYFYAVAAAPYFGPQGDFSSVNAIINNCSAEIDDNIFGEYSNELWNGYRTGNKFDGWAKLAFEAGMKIYCYEGGPDMDYTTGSGGIKDQAMQDPRMTQLCKDYWTKWYSRYGYNSLFCFFQASFNTSGLYTLGEDFYTTSTRQAAINEITTNPAPSFDVSRNIVDPVYGDSIDCRKVVAYMANWETAHNGDYLHADNELNYFIAATRNGQYSISIEHNCATNSSVDIYLDGVRIGANIQLPTTSTVPGDWAFATYQWTSDQGVNILFDMTYGVHLLKFHFIDENGSYKYIRTNLISQNPPAIPAAIQGDIAACLGSANSSYTVEIDGSICQYEWEVEGGSILPPSGGDGAAVTGQGTNLIYVNWNGVPAGRYQIRVRGINDVGSSLWQTDTVSLASCGFTASPNPVCLGSSVIFTPAISGNITSWSWNFGAGAVPTSSIIENPPAITYSYAGNKTVRLVVADQAGDTYTYVNEVVVGQTIAGTATANPSTLTAGSSASVNLTGQNGSVINWEYSTDNITWIPISTVQLPLNTGPLAVSTWYRAVVNDNGCDTVPSLPVLVTVSNPVNIGTLNPSSSSICSGTAGPELTISGNSGTIVRWESRTAVGNWTTVAGESGSTFTPQNVTETTSYRVVLNISGTEYPSQVATITIGGSTSAGTASANPSQVCSGGTTTLILANSTGSIQWQQSGDGLTNWTDVTGATTASCATPSISGDTYFQAIVGGGSCPSLTSNVVHITISNSVVPGEITGTNNFCAGSIIPTLTLSGFSGSSFQWQQSPNGTSFTDIMNATSYIYTPTSYIGNKYFRVSVAQSGCTAAVSDTFQMSSIAVPTFTITPANISTCGVSDGSIQISGLTANTAYLVGYSYNLTNIGPNGLTSNATGEILISNLSAGNYSNFIVDQNGCPATNTNIQTINNPVDIGISSVNFNNPENCNGTGTIKIAILNGSNGRTYSVDYDNNGIPDNSGILMSDTIILTGITDNVLVTNLSITDQVTGCETVGYFPGNITISTKPVVTLSEPGSFCINTPAQTLNNGIPTGGQYTIDGNIVTQLNPLQLGVGNHLLIYEYTNSSNCTNSDTVNFTINALPNAQITGEQTLCPSSISVPYNTDYDSQNQYLWNVNDGTFAQDANPANILVNWFNEPVGQVKVSVLNTITQCVDSSELNISLSDIIPPFINNCIGEYYVKATSDNNGKYYTFIAADTAYIPVATDLCAANNLGFTFSVNGETPLNKSEFIGYRLAGTDQNTIIWSVTDNEGNHTECTSVVYFEYDMIAPTAISPNEDQINDTWQINFLSDNSNCIVKIYNRWGVLIFESTKGYPKNWDGRSNGILVPVDTYYYTIDLGKNINPINGYISVIY